MPCPGNIPGCTGQRALFSSTYPCGHVRPRVPTHELRANACALTSRAFFELLRTRLPDVAVYYGTIGRRVYVQHGHRTLGTDITSDSDQAVNDHVVDMLGHLGLVDE